MLHKRTISAPAILYTDDNHQQQQQNNNNNGRGGGRGGYSQPHVSTPNSVFGPAPFRPSGEAGFAYTNPSGPSPYQPQFLPSALTHTFNTMTLQEPHDANWYMDSGATSHIPDQQGLEKKIQEDYEARSMLYSGEETRLNKQVKPSMLHQRSLSAPAILYTTDSDTWTYGQQPWQPSAATSHSTGQQIIHSEVLKRGANLVVAQDGTGDYKTINDAVKAAPVNSKTRFIIYIKKGIYDEVVKIASTKTNITIVGEGRDKTILTGSLNAKDGVKTFYSATLAVDGAGFIGQGICIRNTAGPAKDQAVALRVSGDASALYLCGIEGYQDTLYAHRNQQFYRECYISGTVDFICGDASAVFQKCRIEARKPIVGQSNMITAQKCEKQKDQSGFSFQKCEIRATSDLAPVKRTVKTYLGRPWGIFSRVVFMECFIDDLIDPVGWFPWESDTRRLSTVYYGEYKNKGPGAGTSGRVKWRGFKVITDTKEAENFTVGKLLYPDSWLKSTGIPYEEGL